MLPLQLLQHRTAQWATRSALLAQKSGWSPSKRAFHASAARQGPLLDTFLYVPHEMMSLLHAHVPWYAVIPLTAFITRGLLVATAGSYARALMARYIGLHPLRQALGVQKRNEILKKGNFRTTKEAVLQVQQEVRKITTELDKRWNVSIKGQISWTLLQLPIFLGMAETIRQKCGARDGLLGLATSPYERGTSLFRTEHAAGESDIDSVPKLDDLAVASSSGPEELTASFASNIGEHAVTHSQWFEPSLANEGFLWFQDLLLPDPTGTLPFIVSGLMFCNIYFTKNTVGHDANWSSVIHRSLLVVTLFVGPLCQDLPAALLLYWASTCKRPLLMPPITTRKTRRA